ncbi:MAG: DUF445 domain-containing protein [Rhodocyclaceae bacterium]|nr:DUF445 domain-containing protein [Rhodocyclaceae bacterium]MBX3669673.1 DUF445 domain-containing protein [Rhodocyclaceae bacterium]
MTPATGDHPPDTRPAALLRMKAVATGLLLAAAGLAALARWQGNAGVWGWVAAFADAAMIGALADWFAVVALFRHPLGLPIPHTAIIARKKARVADSLAQFIRDKFLDTEVLLAKLRAYQPAARLGAWLSEPANADLAAGKLVAALAGALDFVDDARVRERLGAALHRRLANLDLARAVGKLLGALTAGGRHQQLLDAALQKMSLWLGEPDTQKSLAAIIFEMAGRDYPLVLKALGVVTDTTEFSQRIAAAIAQGIQGWMQDIATQPEHPRRQQFDALIADYIARAQDDSDFRDRLAGAKQDMLAEPLLADYLNGLWDELKNWLLADLHDPASSIREKLGDTARSFGAGLADHPGLRASLDDHLEKAARALATDLRDATARHIAATVKAWRDEDLVRELELNVGRDLQFIRINGTLVGGSIGLALHALQKLV